jgi:hypothetical protein
MASKKVNPEQLAKLAKQKAGSAAQFRKAEEAGKKKGSKPKAPVSPTTTVPPSPPSTDVWDFIGGGTTSSTTPSTTSTTSTTIPTTSTTLPVTTTTVPVTTTTVKPYGKPGEKVNIMGMSVTLDKDGNINKEKYPYAWAINQDILARESEALLRTSGQIPKKSGGFWGTVGNIVGKGLEYTVAKPLMALDAPRRVIISGGKEILEAAVPGGESGSWGDFTKQASDVNFGVGSIKQLQTGNIWVDRAIGFVGDVALDPTTYLTLGTGTAAKMTLKGASKYVATKVVADAAQDIGVKTVKEITKEAAEKIAKDLGKEAVDKEARTLARAVVVEAAQQAKAGAKQAGNKALENVTDKALKEATNRWAVAGPRRQLGAKTKEAMADGIRQLRDEALQEAQDFAGTAAGRRAQDFVDTITDEVLVDIATRGYAALGGQVGQQLGIKGGFRLGAGRAKTYLGGAPLTRGVGKVAAATRLKPLRGQGVIGDASRYIADKITPQGADGLFNSDDIFDWRTGLRQARFADAAQYREGVRAIELLGEDAAYRGAKKSAVNSTKAVLKESLADKAYKPFYKTVQEVLSSDETLWDGVRAAAEDLNDELVDEELAALAWTLGRPTKEVEFAWKIKQGVDALYQSTVDLAARGGADITGVGSTAKPSSWYPLTVTNRTARWLRSTGRGMVGPDGKLIPGTAPREVAKQLNLRGIKLGTAVPDQLKEGMTFFNHELTDLDIRGGISRLNQIARDGGFEGEFFDTNIVSAIDRWSNKWAGDYAFLKRYVDNLLGDIGLTYKSPLVEEERVAAGLPATGGVYGLSLDTTTIGGKAKTSKFSSKKTIDEAIMSGIDDIDETFPAIKDWSIDDYELLRETIADTHAKALKFADSKQRMLLDDAYKSITLLLDQLISIKRFDEAGPGMSALFGGPDAPALLKGIYEGDDAIASIFGLTDDQMTQMSDFIRLFSKNKNQVLDFAKGMDAQTLRTMVNLTEDAYVALGNQIVPDINVRADIAEFYNNIRRYKNPKAAKGALEFIKYYTNTFKTWATTSVGFHTRNIVSNAWQMLAAGGNPTTLLEGAKIYRDFNKFLDRIKNDIDYRQQILKEAGFDDADLYWSGRFTPENLVEEFLTGSEYTLNLSPTQKYAVMAAFLDSGAVSAGDLEDIFGVVPVGARKVGFTGSEISEQLGTGIAKRVPKALGKEKIPGALQKASEYAGMLPAVSRAFGNNVEKLNRFMFTYDGIRQGYSAAESAARTSRFLVDYEDLSSADEFMKQVIPFWMWVSRNLPVQIQNMYANPGIYQKYNNFRRNIEDEQGNNPLLPDWLEKSGAFKLPFGGGSSYNLYARPDFGFPGTGSPSPFIEGVSDRASLAQGLNPAIRTLIEAWQGRDLQYGTPIEGFGANAQNVAEDILTPASWLGRIGNIGLAQSDLPGPQWIQEILGVQGPEVKYGEETYRKDSPAWQPRVNALMSFLGIPGRIVGPNEENVARREYLRELEAYKKWLESQGG